MPDNSNSVVQILPFAVRRKVAMQIAGCGSTELQARINAGRYQSFLDGVCRFVVTQSILDDQKRLAEADTPAKPLGRGSGRRGRPRKPKT
jgi:hypothetical protein